MDLPSQEMVPNRKLWKTLRDNAGGKSGMSKAEVGPALDDFHKAYETAKKKDDLGPLNKAITALGKTIATYIAEVKKTDPKVAKVAEERIKDQLDRFKLVMLNTAKAGTRELNDQVAKLDDIISTNKEADQVLKAIGQISAGISKIRENFKKSPGSKAELLKTAQGLQKKALEYEEVANKLQSDFQTDVASVDPAIAESRQKQLNETRDNIRKIRNATIANLGDANKLVEDLSSK